MTDKEWRDKFVILRQGKEVVLYAGLLDLAHRNGLVSIITTPVQFPTEDNSKVAICTATVTLEKDGKTLLFTGVGDAAPNNVTPAMQTCLLRMSETRAKGRALRDAVNVGMATLEELGNGAGDDSEDAAPPPADTPKPTALEQLNDAKLKLKARADEYNYRGTSPLLAMTFCNLPEGQAANLANYLATIAAEEVPFIAAINKADEIYCAKKGIAPVERIAAPISLIEEETPLAQASSNLSAFQSDFSQKVGA